MSILNDLLEYSSQCIEGEVICCQKHKWCCERFMCDLDRVGDDDFPYIFDEAKAERFLKWMTYFQHTKGPLAGKPKIAEPVEKLIFAQVYGWVDKDTGHRRFRNVYWQVARKNAKSQDLAIVGLYEMACMGESAAEVYIAATKRDQTRYVWEEADLIYKKSEFSNKFKTKYGGIHHIKSGSIFSRMSEEDRKKGDGGNPQCGIIDEYHAHETDEFYNILTSGMKTRVQPLLIIITTAGFDLDHPCYRDEYQYASKILDPNTHVNNDRYFALINELDKDIEGNLIDDINDEAVWIKSNPILMNSKEGVAALRSELKVALDKPEKMRDFLTKSMNVWVSMREAGYMEMAKWKLCEDTLPDLSGKPCILGLDLSAKIDLTSVCFEFNQDDKYYLYSHSFMPAETVNRRRNEDRAPYDLWIRDGWITAIPGSVIDYRVVKDYVIDKAKEMGWMIEEWCMDPWGTLQLSQELQDDGHTVVEIVQGIKTLSEPTKDFRNMVYSKRVVHDGNPVLSWAMSNAIIDKIDRNENIILNKKKSKSRIDPAAACVNAHVRAMVNIPQGDGRVIFI